MSHKVNIIYFIWINPNRNWQVIVDGQLSELKVANVFDNCKLHIVLSCNNENIMNEAINVINRSLVNIDKNKYSIDTNYDNIYEYYGIKKLYDIAKSEPDKLFIYMHSKGMFNWYNNNPNKRSEDEVNLTRHTIYLWKDIVDVYEKNPNINLIGLFPSIDGWVWFNFFWVRGSHLITCEEPKISRDNRYYYESWVSSGNKNSGVSYSIYSHDFKKYTPEEAIQNITKLR